MILKMILILIAISATLSATVFDYRYYYGNINSESDNVNSYSVNVYTYFYNSDFSYGAQIQYANTNKTIAIEEAIIDLSGSIGYDLSKNTRTEINLGNSYITINDKYYTGYNVSASIMYQILFNTYLEALQFGVSVKYNWSSQQEMDKANNTLKERMRTMLFLGIGF